MRIDQQKLEKRVRNFIQSSQGDEIIEELENSVLFNIIGTLIMLPISLLLILTIIFARIGFEMLLGLVGSIFNGEVFRDQQRQLRENPEKLKPLILCSIIVGPNDHGLALGSLNSQDQQRTDIIGAKALHFGEVYSQGADDPDDEDLQEILQDDIYVPYRRREVPKESCAGLDLWLFDMEFDLDEMHQAENGTVWLAALATEDSKPGQDGSRGRIIQIPWKVAAPAVLPE